MEKQQYQLGGYVIQEEEDQSLYWGSWLEDYPEAGKQSRYQGKAWLFNDCDTLLLSCWKVMGLEEESKEAIQRYLESLPIWNKTKYFIKMADFGHSPLLDCQTLEPVPDDVADAIMPKLGFKKAPAGMIEIL